MPNNKFSFQLKYILKTLTSFISAIGKRNIQSDKCWIAECEPSKTVVKRGIYESKTMFFVFFKSTGPVFVTYVDKGKTVDNQFYIKSCLRYVVEEINKQRPLSGTKNVKLLHDNARPHVHSNVLSYLERKGIKVIPHPHYSPDLAPCDFWLFSNIKQNLRDAVEEEDLYKQITSVLKIHLKMST